MQTATAANVLVNHPYFGSLWLSDCYIVHGIDGREYVVGDFWDDSDVGSLLLPDDYPGEPVTMNFPITCIRKDPSGLTATAPNKGED